MSSIDVKEVPGGYGLPVLGLVLHTVGFLRGWREFYTQRQERFGSTVFRAAAGVKAVTILDQQGIEAIFDASQVEKLYGFGPLRPPAARIGGILPCVFSNGETHERLKTWLMGIQANRLGSVYEVFDRVSSPYFDRWVQQGSFDWGADINLLYADFLFEYFLGARPDPRDVEFWSYNLLPRIPLRFPGQGDKPFIEAMNRLLKVIRSARLWPETAAAARETAGIDEDEASKQLLFYLGFNAYTGLGSVTRSAIGELDGHEAVRKDAIEEVKLASSAQSYDGGVQSTALLEATPMLRNILRETMRLHMPAPFAYARATRDFVLESSSGRFQIRKGELLHGVIGVAQRDPGVFDQPRSFRPERYAEEKAVSGVIWANGREPSSPTASDKMCAGRDIVYLSLHQFLFKLLEGYDYRLSKRPVEWSDTRMEPANRPVTPILAGSFSKGRS